MDLLTDDLFAELESFVDNETIESETRRDPEDMRQAKQDYNRFKLKKLVQTLKILNNEENRIPVEKLAKRVKMKAEELKLHDSELEFFQDMADRGKSYAEAIDILRTNKLREVRVQVLQRLRSLQKDKKLKPNMIVNLEYIKSIAKEFAEGKWWLWNFGACSSWARDIRLEFQKYKPCHLKNSRSKHFKQLIGWVKEKMHETEELSYDTTKAKYEEIFGKKCKKWTNTANRIRKRLSLDFKCVNERFKGSRGRSRVRKQYYFIAKEE